jgi:hypothetical protein
MRAFNNKILKKYFLFKGSRFVITYKYQKYGIIYSKFVFFILKNTISVYFD